jgi:hypothetical protein
LRVPSVRPLMKKSMSSREEHDHRKSGDHVPGKEWSSQLLTLGGTWYESCNAAVVWGGTVGVLRPQRQERDGARGNDI